MKKLLLSLAAALLCASAAFADAVVVIKDQTCFNGGGATMNAPESWTNGDFTFTTAKNDGQTAPAYNKAGDLRLYAKNTFGITAKNAMTSIVFDISTQGLKRLAPVTASTGTITTQAAGDTKVTWTGNAAEVVFTVGEKADFGTDGNTKGGQLDFTQITIVGGGELGGGGSVEPEEPNYFKATTVESGSSYVFVAGEKYNAQYNPSSGYGYMQTFALPAGTTDSFFGDETAILTITAVTGGYTIQNNVGKFLGSTAEYASFNTYAEQGDNCVWTINFNADGTANIVNTSSNKAIAQDPNYGSFGVYLAADLEGKNLPTLFKFKGSILPPPEPTYVDCTLVNTISDGEFAFVSTLDGVTKVGTAISATATYGRLALVDVTVTNNTVGVEEVNLLTITAVNGGYTIQDSYNRYLGFDPAYATSFQLYNEANANTIWNIAMTNGQAVITMELEGSLAEVGTTKGTSGTWYSNISLSVGSTEIALPALYKKGGDSGVGNIVVDQNAPVVYYNLQGVRVANPENGLFIRVQGNSTSKVFIR